MVSQFAESGVELGMILHRDAVEGRGFIGEFTPGQLLNAIQTVKAAETDESTRELQAGMLDGVLAGMIEQQIVEQTGGSN